MSLNGMLYDFIDNLNKAVNFSADEFTDDFDSEEFTAIEKETEKTVKIKIAVVEDDYEDVDGFDRFTYKVGLRSMDAEGIDVEEMDAYEFNDAEITTVIKNYAGKIRYFMDNQKIETEKRLYDLFQFMLKIDNGTFIGKYQM